MYFNKKSVTISRSDNNEHIIASLSEESIRKRRRKNTIGIQITVISWLLELLGNIIMVSRYLTWQHVDDTELSNDRIFHFFGIFVTLILLPGSYLLNSEAVKLLIAAKGWTTFARNNIARCFQQNTSEDEENWIAWICWDS